MPDTETPRQFLRASEVAHRLSCGRSTVYMLARTRKIPSVIIGQTGRRFDWPAVLAALKHDAK